MSLTYTYEITGIKVKDVTVANTNIVNSNAIVQVYWTLTGTDTNNNSATFNGATPFNPQSNTFVSFEKVSTNDVIKWVSEVVANTPSYQSHIEEQIQHEIDKNTNTLRDATLLK